MKDSQLYCTNSLFKRNQFLEKLKQYLNKEKIILASRTRMERSRVEEREKNFATKAPVLL